MRAADISLNIIHWNTIDEFLRESGMDHLWSLTYSDWRIASIVTKWTVRRRRA